VRGRPPAASVAWGYCSRTDVCELTKPGARPFEPVSSVSRKGRSPIEERALACAHAARRAHMQRLSCLGGSQSGAPHASRAVVTRGHARSRLVRDHPNPHEPGGARMGPAFPRLSANPSGTTIEKPIPEKRRGRSRPPSPLLPRLHNYEDVHYKPASLAVRSSGTFAR